MARTPHRRSDRVSNLGGRHELGQNEVVQADLLAFDYGPRPHHVVSNVPFGITTTNHTGGDPATARPAATIRADPPEGPDR